MLNMLNKEVIAVLVDKLSLNHGVRRKSALLQYLYVIVHPPNAP